MMTVNNFINVVTLGNFNPAILTPNFLKNICKIELGSPDQTPQITPFQSIISYGNVSFNASIDRFQITEKSIEDFSKTKIVDYLNQYLSRLEYTPISAIGINFNINMEDLKIEVFEKNIIEEKTKLLELLNAKELLIGNLVKYKSDTDQEKVSYDIGFPIDAQDTLGRITLKRKEKEGYNLTYNYEVRNLETKRNNIDQIIKKYPDRLREFHNFIARVYK